MTHAPAPKRAVRAAFDKAAGDYDAVASVQRTACDHLLALVSTQDFSPDRILDAGCGTGYALAGLKRRFPAADPTSDAFADMTITDTRANARVFSGWMIALSPALSALDDARYDVWVISCTKA